MSCVLETSPLPVTPPQRGDRGHDLMTESWPPCYVQQYNLRPRVAITFTVTGVLGQGIRMNLHAAPRFDLRQGLG